MSQSGVKFTYQDYLLMPEDKRYELIGGEFFMVPSPSWLHQAVSKEIFLALHTHVTAHNLGVVCYAPLDVILSEEDVVQPDILYVSKERNHVITEQGVQGSPDLVVEILSPSTRERDLQVKRKLYTRYGISEYWIVNPAAKVIEVLALKGEEYEASGIYRKDDTLSSPLLKGLQITLKNLF